MPRVLLAAVPLLAGFLPLAAAGLGLGEISRDSALNQPFAARIPVSGDSAEELRQLQVTLAPRAAFERLGLDQAAYLQDFTFRVEGDGPRGTIHVTSARPVSEPFVSFLVEVNWPGGRLLREYTVLLDPPGFASGDAPGRAARVAAAPGPAPLPRTIERAGAGERPADGAVQTPGIPGPATAQSAAATPPPPPPPTPIPDAGEAAPGPAAPASPSTFNSDTYGPVRRNETLWAIADRVKPEGPATHNQVMMALFRANPEAFAGNINHLKAGAILRVPDAAEIGAISRRDANSEVSRQTADWQGGPSTPPAEPDRLELVPPAETPVPAATDRPPAVTDQPGTATDSSRVQELESRLAESERLLTLKDDQLQALQDRLARAEAGGAAPVVSPEAAAEPGLEAGPTEEVTPADEVAIERLPGEAQPAPAPPADTGQPADVPVDAPAVARAARAPDPVDEPSFLATLGAMVFNTWFLVAAALVLLAGLFLVFGRRRQEAAADGGFGVRTLDTGTFATRSRDKDDDFIVEEATPAERPREVPAVPRPVRSDAETPLERTISSDGAVQLDQADVLSEADFHMAYGLYDQAAELLSRGLRENPDRRDLRMKLIEVYFIWENKPLFLQEAKVFRERVSSPSDPDWSKVLIMGKQMLPNEPLFAGAAISAPGVEGVDFTLAEDSGTSIDVALGDDGPESAGHASSDEGSAAGSDLLDFDFGETPAEDSGLMQTDIASGLRTAEVPTVRAPMGESPTIESPTLQGRYAGSSTMETPTLETAHLDHPTMETPTLETRMAPTMETPTLESAVPGFPGRALSQNADQTEELNLEDLGLDLAGLDEVAQDLGTGVHEAVTEPDEGTLDLPAISNAMQRSAGRTDRTADTAEFKAIEDTAEQPRPVPQPTGALGEDSAELMGMDFVPEVLPEIEATAILKPRGRGADGPTMTEVGTKLDLARAYIDMGDPEGARSILNEVLEEGDTAQKQEARQLLDDLAD